MVSEMIWAGPIGGRPRAAMLLLMIALASTSGACRHKEVAAPTLAPPPHLPPATGVVSDGIVEGLQSELEKARTDNGETAARVKSVRPVLNCVEPLSATEWRAHFGYTNTSSEEVPISVSFFNRFWPPPLGRDQPTVFKPGSREDVAQAKFNPRSSTAWVLGSAFAMANGHSTPCAKTPSTGK
jgi:hypothetical protein